MSELVRGEGMQILLRTQKHLWDRLAEIEDAGELNPKNMEAKDLLAATRIVSKLIYGDVPAILPRTRWA